MDKKIIAINGEDNINNLQRIAVSAIEAEEKTPLPNRTSTISLLNKKIIPQIGHNTDNKNEVDFLKASSRSLNCLRAVNSLNFIPLTAEN